MYESRKGCGLCGALTAALVGLGRGRRDGTGNVGPPDMDEEADQHESEQEELVKQQVWCHDKVPSHMDERRPLYRSHPLPNYPLDAGTYMDPPALSRGSRVKKHAWEQMPSDIRIWTPPDRQAEN